MQVLQCTVKFGKKRAMISDQCGLFDDSLICVEELPLIHTFFVCLGDISMTKIQTTEINRNYVNIINRISKYNHG